MAKYNSSGQCQWAKVKPGSYDSSTGQTYDGIYAVAIDGSDNIYISMFNYATPVTFCGLNFPTKNSYLVKINSNGNGIWAKQTSNGANGFSTLALTYLNNRIYSSVQYVGVAVCGPNTYTSTGSSDIAILKMDTSGSILSSSSQSGTGMESALGITASNDKVITLSQSGSNVISIGTNTLSMGSSKDKTFLVSYDTSNLIVKNYRNTANDSLGSGSGLYNDKSGNIYVTVNNFGTTGFGNLTNVPTGRHMIKMDGSLQNYWHGKRKYICCPGYAWEYLHSRCF